MTTTASPPQTPSRRRQRWNRALWIMQWTLGPALIGAGVFKLAMPDSETAQQFPWADQHPVLFTATSVLDILGGLGVLLPALTKILPWLTWVAAGGVVALMISAAVFHLLRGEAEEIGGNIVLALLAGFLAWGRLRIAPIVARIPEPPRFPDPLPDARPPRTMQVFQLPTGSYSTPAALAFRGGRAGEQRSFVSTAVLIEHPQGDLLIDAGLGQNVDDHISSLPSYRRSPHVLRPTVSEQLHERGYDLSRLRGVLVTHTHWDHVSGLDSLDVPVWITAEELDHARKATGDRVFTEVAEGHERVLYQFDGPPHLGFPASHDVYGDGSVVIVPAHGHTAGSVIVFVVLPDSRRYAFIGDLAWQMDAISGRVERPLLMQVLADSNPKQIRTDLARILAVADRYQIVPAHDARGYDGIPLLRPGH